MPVAFNHLTIAVRDLSRSVSFYADVVGLRLVARWKRGAYLTAGATWICLSQDDDAGAPPAYTHFAFGCPAAELSTRAALVRASGATIWKDNESEGESVYFLDPDGHKLELHVGDLGTRLEHCRAQPYDDMRFSRARETVVAVFAGGLELSVEAHPPAHDCAAIAAGLSQHADREAETPPRDAKPLGVFIRSTDASVVAGLIATTVWGWLHVKELWVAAELRRRGLGTAIMDAAEQEAKERGCHHALLDTFDFQARPFYERRGYRCFGELPDFPLGHRRFFMAKALA